MTPFDELRQIKAGRVEVMAVREEERMSGNRPAGASVFAEAHRSDELHSLRLRILRVVGMARQAVRKRDLATTLQVSYTDVQNAVTWHLWFRVQEGRVMLTDQGWTYFNGGCG